MSEAGDMGLVVVGAAGRMGQTLIRAIHGIRVPVSSAPSSARVRRIWQGCRRARRRRPHRRHDQRRSAAALRQGRRRARFHHAGGDAWISPDLAAQARIVHVIGTTGARPTTTRRSRPRRATRAIVKSGNMSLGVNLLAALVSRRHGRSTPRFRHRDPGDAPPHKVDAPSGTALLLGRGRGRGPRHRSSPTTFGAQPRRPYRRAQARRYRLRHAARRLGGRRAQRHPRRRRRAHHAVPPCRDRAIFARGAVKAALWGRGRKPGCTRWRRARAGDTTCANASGRKSLHTFLDLLLREQ